MLAKRNRRNEDRTGRQFLLRGLALGHAKPETLWGKGADRIELDGRFSPRLLYPHFFFIFSSFVFLRTSHFSASLLFLFLENPPNRE